MRRVASFLGVAGGILSMACGGGSAAGTAATRDSAGITIVENSGPAWTAANGWRVIDSPSVDIGGRTGEAAYEFDQVTGPLRLSDGRIAVGNGGSKEIRFYDAKGVHQRSSGREGNGPGEYTNVTGIWLGPGDSVAVFDVFVRRVTVLDDTGAVGRSVSLGEAGTAFMPVDGRLAFAIPQAWLGDGSFVAQAQVFAVGQARAGVYRDSISLLRYGPDGAVRDTLGRYPGIEMEQMTLKMGERSFPAPQPIPLGRQTVTAAGAGRFYVGRNDGWEIEVRGMDGSLQQLVRTAFTPASITPAEVAEHRKQTVEQMEAVPQIRNLPDALKKQFTARIEQVKYPDTYPVFAAFLLDPEGNLWAQEVTPPSQKAQRYAVIDSTGRFLGRVTMPVDFRVTQIGSDAVYGVWKDADDLERIRAYPLRKG
jgi:hypothetical protein